MRRTAENMFLAALLLSMLATVVSPAEVGLRMVRAAAIVEGYLPAPTEDFVSNVANEGLLEVSTYGWWGERPLVRADGGDYLSVLGRVKSNNWTPSWVLGAVVERERLSGVRFRRLIVPADTELLFLEPEIVTVDRAAGAEPLEFVRSQFNAASVRRLTDVPLVELDYDPVIPGEELHDLQALADHEYSAYGFDLVRAPDQIEGEWILHIDPDEDSHFYLVPLELSPVEGDS